MSNREYKTGQEFRPVNTDWSGDILYNGQIYVHTSTGVVGWQGVTDFIGRSSCKHVHAVFYKPRTFAGHENLFMAIAKKKNLVWGDGTVYEHSVGANYQSVDRSHERLVGEPNKWRLFCPVFDRQAPKGRSQEDLRAAYDLEIKNARDSLVLGYADILKKYSEAYSATTQKGRAAIKRIHQRYGSTYPNEPKICADPEMSQVED